MQDCYLANNCGVTDPLVMVHRLTNAFFSAELIEENIGSHIKEIQADIILKLPIILVILFELFMMQLLV